MNQTLLWVNRDSRKAYLNTASAYGLVMNGIRQDARGRQVEPALCPTWRKMLELNGIAPVPSKFALLQPIHSYLASSFYAFSKSIQPVQFARQR
jgi:hypothetical protein